MKNELINKITNLSFLGYYDYSKNLVVVHFFNKDDEKNDIIAYLKKDMSWDVREVIEETSELGDDYETITLKHSSLGNYPQNSKFDQFMRNGLVKMAESEHPDTDLKELDKMFSIFEQNSYDN